MDRLFLLSGATRQSTDVDAWFAASDLFRLLTQPWFEQIRACGPDITALIHDGCPTACVGDAAFADGNALTAHAAVGFFHGAALPDPPVYFRAAAGRCGT